MDDTNPSSPASLDGPSTRRAYGEIALYFLKLGFTAFGGPAAHIAMMEQELVTRRDWLSRRHFLDLLAAVNFIPGPTSTELALMLGRVRGGMRGLLIAGACFILPALLIILPIAWLYVTYGQKPAAVGVFKGISAAVVAIVAAAAIRLGRSVIKDPLAASIALLAALAEGVSHRRQWTWGDVLILAAAAGIGAMRSTRPTASATTLSLSPAPLAALPLAALLWTSSIALAGPLLMTLLFLKIGATLFGSGYVLVTYLQSSLVDQRHWLTQQQMLDAVAVGQLTPGPLLTSATFIGFVLGHRQFGYGLRGEIACALAATIAIFAPAFVLVTLLGGWMQRLRRYSPARGALDATNAAVVGLIAATCVSLTFHALAPPSTWISLVLIAASLLVLLRWQLNSTWLIAVAALVGWLCL